MSAWKLSWKPDVSWKRAILAIGATMLSVYALAFALSASGAPPSVVWIFLFVILANAVNWGVILYPSKNKPRVSSQ